MQYTIDVQSDAVAGPCAESAKRRGKASREETAHKVAWSAVERVYEKGHDNKWHRKN